MYERLERSRESARNAPVRLSVVHVPTRQERSARTAPAAPLGHRLAEIAVEPHHAVVQRYVSSNVANDPLGLAPSARQVSAASAVSPANFGWIRIAVPANTVVNGWTAQPALPNGDLVFLLERWSAGGAVQTNHSEQLLVAAATAVIGAAGRARAATDVGQARILDLFTERRPCTVGNNPCHAFLNTNLHAETPVYWLFDVNRDDDSFAMLEYQRKALVHAWYTLATARAALHYPGGRPAEVGQTLLRFREDIDAASTAFLMRGRSVAQIDRWIREFYVPSVPAVAALFAAPKPVVKPSVSSSSFGGPGPKGGGPGPSAGGPGSKGGPAPIGGGSSALGMVKT